MDSPKLHPGVKLLVQAWLEQRGHLFDLIVEEIADELAPFVAHEVTKDLAVTLAARDPSDLVRQLSKAAQAAADIINNFIKISDAHEPDAAAVVTDLVEAVQLAASYLGDPDPYDIPFEPDQTKPDIFGQGETP
jgi:hypothetical protein